jgi:hypothetical protein
MMSGKVASKRDAQTPLAIERSIGFIPAARTLISTCPGPGWGSGTSTRAGAAPYSETATARTKILPAPD